MWRNMPIKTVANGEPAYVNGGKPGRADGWWQGHEVWSNLCADGTMGVVYGAGSLWQWRLHPDEPGHASYFLADRAGWSERSKARARATLASSRITLRIYR